MLGTISRVGEEYTILPNGILWWPSKAMGFYPISKNGVYDKPYFEKYVAYSKTPMGLALTQARIDLVERHVASALITDVGIGCGQFVEARGRNTSGYDVNLEGIRWLLDRGLWSDPYCYDLENVTCWDSLEHMRRPWQLLECVRSHVFLSIPIFADIEHLGRSKHFRPDEHYWYFTRDGLVRWMASQGFELLEENRMEEQLGREDIGTFVFKKSGQRV